MTVTLIDFFKSVYIFLCFEWTTDGWSLYVHHLDKCYMGVKLGEGREGSCEASVKLTVRNAPENQSGQFIATSYEFSPQMVV